MSQLDLKEGRRLLDSMNTAKKKFEAELKYVREAGVENSFDLDAAGYQYDESVREWRMWRDAWDVELFELAEELMVKTDAIVIYRLGGGNSGGPHETTRS